MTYRWWMAAPIALMILLVMPQAGDSCGPFIASMMFTTYHGLLPGDLESGHLGVVRPHFWRKDLLLAYRAFSGVPLAKDEPAESQTTPSEDRAKAWLEARRKVAGAPPLDRLTSDRKVAGSDFQQYSNCLDGAFTSAIVTLNQRISTWGAASPQLAEWLRGQDQVFQNCESGATIPAAAPTIAADREYQIAAAEFYAEQYDKAEDAFDRIAKEQVSPWHDIAPYLAARACIRQATIGVTPGKMEEASKRLEALVKDPTRQQWHAPATELLGFVKARLEPGQRLVELGDQLMKPNLGLQLSRVLTDYTKIWDSMEEKSQPYPVEQSDVAAWIAAFQTHSLKEADWHARHTPPWLIAALVWAPPTDPAVPDLIRAAHAIMPDSPAYASAVYYGILRQIRAGELDAARQWADDALSKTQSPAAINLLRSERLRLARNWAEFLRFSTRRPVATDTFDGPDEPMAEDEIKKHEAAFDRDTTEALNRATPLQLWIDAASGRGLPAQLQADIAQAGWVRAVLLNQTAAARTLAQRLAELKPDLAGELKKYLADADPAAAQFTAVFLFLRAPGLEPTVRPGFPRESPVLERDMLRDNWWILGDGYSNGNAEPQNHDALYDLYPDGKSVPPDFLPKDQRTAGEAQWRTLMDRAANSVNYLCAETLAWAKSHPRDPRVPQALHEAVVATRFGHADKSSSAFSKQAFDLLHLRYPDSDWTRQTKYWY